MAMWAFLFGALTNLNPLLEWDGYFMLMDWLEIPMLRRRSMDFVKRKMLGKITSRGSFSREEKIFAVFGVAAMVYTVTIIIVAMLFWRSRVASFVSLFEGWVFWLLIGFIVVIVGVPVLLAVGVLGLKVAKRVRSLAYEHLFKGKPANQVAALFIAPIAAALPVLFFGEDSSEAYAALVGALALALGVRFSLLVAPWYFGSRLQSFFLAISWLMVLLLVAQVLSQYGGVVSTPAKVIALGIVPGAMCYSLLRLYPTLISYTRTVLQGAWGIIASGAAFLLIGALVALSTGESGGTPVLTLELLGYGLLTAGLFRLYQQLRSLHTEQRGSDAKQAVSDAERLTSAIRFVVDSTMEQFIQIHGRRAQRALEEQFNAGAATESGWGFSIENGHLVDTGKGSMVEMSQKYAAALSHLFAVKSRIAGRGFVDRQLRSLYRLMPWEEREIGEQYLFFRLDWTGGVQRAITGGRRGHSGLLRSVPLFTKLSDEEIKEISDRLRSEKYNPGRDIIKQGEPGRKFYIIDSGTVEARVRHEDGTETVEAEMGRGAYFGERALLTDEPRSATCRAKSQVQALSLDRDDFTVLVARRFQLVRTAPLFAGLGEDEIKVISDRLQSETHPKGRDIIEQGEPGTKFYLIESGTVEVWVRQDDGTETQVAELGRGDYFGERALLTDEPRAATCRCKTGVKVLSLEKEDFKELVAKSFQMGADLDEAMDRAELLATMPLFSELNSSQVKKVASKLMAESHPAGSLIIRQGDIGDRFHVVKSGTVEVRRRAEGTEEETRVGQLGRGEYFGEIALLMKVPRTASVIAQTDVELLSLDDVSFEEMVKDYLQSSTGLEQASSRRMIQLRRAEGVGYREAA